MFQAILFRKLDESIFAEHGLYEDILTSDVFGAFKYLPADYLHAWIAKLRDRHPLLTPAFRLAQEMPDIEFWPQLYAAKEAGNYCEPDVVLWWEQLGVVIEAKRGSHFSVGQLQLERESTQHAAMAQGQATHVIVVAVGRNRPAWWWEQRQSTKHWLAFSSWGTLADVFEATLSVRRAAGVHLEEAALVGDLLARLQMRDIQPFRGFRSLASLGPPSSPPLLPCAVTPLSGVFPILASAPEPGLSEIWSSPSRSQTSFVSLAKAAPTHKATHLVVREVRCVSLASGFSGLSRVAPRRLVNAWPLKLVSSPATQHCVIAWKNAPHSRLAKVWRPPVRGGCSVRVRGAAATEASRLFWNPNR